MPQQVSSADGLLSLDGAAFMFQYVGYHNGSSQAEDILEQAFVRYAEILFGSLSAAAPIKAPAGSLASLHVNISNLDDELQLYTSENYTLRVAADGSPGMLTCVTVYGCLRGLETFSQLIVRPTPGQYAVTGVPIAITDWPRFPHRGLLVDSSRHFLPLETIFSIIDALSYDKANTLHWHFTDVQSFPVAIAAAPELAQGAWAPPAIYTRADLEAVVGIGAL
jgi:hexosaminidase